MQLTFANNYTTPGGRTYKAGNTYTVNDADARSLIFRGTARVAEEPGTATADTPETQENTSDQGE